MKKILVILMVLISAMMLFAACSGSHSHTFSDDWTSDATDHWHAATCEHKDEKGNKGQHDFDDDGECTVCGYKKQSSADCDHSLFKTEAKAPTCTKDGNVEYWFCSQCGKYFSDANGEHEIEKDSVVKPKTGHQYESKLTPIDRENHGYKPTCGDTTEYKDVAKHNFDSNNKCSDCGYVLRADTSEYAGKYYSYYEGNEGWETNVDFYIEIGNNSNGLMHDSVWDYQTESYIETNFDLSIEIDEDEITIEYTQDSNKVIRDGFIGDGVKLGEGVIVIEWGGGGYYFCKEDCIPEVISGDFVLQYYDPYTIFSSEDWEPANEYSIIAYLGNEANVVIPDTINNIPVVRIEGSQVFAGRSRQIVKLSATKFSKIFKRGKVVK